MSSQIQAVSNHVKTEVEVVAKATVAARQSGRLGIGRILGSKEGSAILSVVVGAAIAAASSSPAGLFAAATVYLLTENFLINKKFHRIQSCRRSNRGSH